MIGIINEEFRCKFIIIEVLFVIVVGWVLFWESSVGVYFK